MKLLPQECCVLNGGDAAWAFEPLAGQLSSSLRIDVCEKPRRFNYLLQVDDSNQPVEDVFIPTASIRLASDKRLLAEVFREHEVPTPLTRLFDTYEDVSHFVRAHSEKEWCLKYPTSCGAAGHTLITQASLEPPDLAVSFHRSGICAVGTS
jgi:hypothetical protein